MTEGIELILYLFRKINITCKCAYKIVGKKMRFCLNNSNIAIITVKGFHYHSVIHDISKSEALHLLKNSVLDDSGYK